MQVKAEETDGELQKMEKKAAKLEAATASGVEETAALEAGLKKLQAAREREGDGLLTQLENELHEVVSKEARVAAGRKNLEDTVASDVKRRQQVLKSIKGDEKLLEERAAHFAGGKDEFTAADATGKQLAEALEAARKRHEAASMGMFVDEHGNASSLQQQAINAEKTAIGAHTQVRTGGGGRGRGLGFRDVTFEPTEIQSSDLHQIAHNDELYNVDNLFYKNLT